MAHLLNNDSLVARGDVIEINWGDGRKYVVLIVSFTIAGQWYLAPINMSSYKGDRGGAQYHDPYPVGEENSAVHVSKLISVLSTKTLIKNIRES